MKIWLGAVGKLKEPYLVAAEADYVKRLRPYCTLAVHEAKDEAGLLGAVPDGAHIYAFDERGELVTSEDARRAARRRGRSRRRRARRVRDRRRGWPW